MSWKNKLKSTIKEFHKWHYNMKNIKLSVRLEESNIETLKIEIENKGRSKLEKNHKPDFIDIVFKKKKKRYVLQIFPLTQ